MGILQGAEVFFGSEKPGVIDLETVSQTAWERSRTLSCGDLSPDLVSSLLTASWCGKRLGKYPSAKDSKEAISSVRKNFEEISETFTPEEIKQCISLLDDFDPRIIKPQLEELSDNEKCRIIYSPLFKEFHNFYPQIEPEEFETFYSGCRENFTEAGIASLRRKFKQVPPEELSNRTDWAQSCHQYLPAFLKKWREELKKIELRMRIAQKAWKESIS
jgi:hypothetical protein